MTAKPVYTDNSKLLMKLNLVELLIMYTTLQLNFMYKNSLLQVSGKNWITMLINTTSTLLPYNTIWPARFYFYKIIWWNFITYA